MALYNNSGNRVVHEAASVNKEKFGITRPMSSKEFVGYACENYNAKLSAADAAVKKHDADFERRLNEESYYRGRAEALKNAKSKYGSFLEDCRSILVNETLYKLVDQALPTSIKENTETKGILKNIVSQYVEENGAMDIYFNMKKASCMMSECALAVDRAMEAIKEDTSPDDKEFIIKATVKDKFFDDLDDSDMSSVDKLITDRVNTAINDFIASNSKNRMDIKSVLQATDDKINELKDEGEDEGVQESYTQLSKRVINDRIRNRPKNIFDSMVNAMCESTIEDKVLQEEFMTEGNHLDISKIVDRTKIMYTFMEAMNTSGMEIANENYVNGVLKSMHNL